MLIIDVINPFNYLTKGEVVKLIENGKGIAKTISCAHPSNFNDKKSQYCGMCMPCILRIIALISSGVNSDKKISKGGINPFLIDLDNLNMEDNVPNWNIFTKNFYRDSIVNLLDLIKFADEIQSYSKENLLSKYYEFYDESLFKMYIRFSLEIIKTLNYFSSKNPSLKNRIPLIKRSVIERFK